MLYDFKDTIANEASASSLPSEAINFNGQFIEHLIPGYRTLTVSGRETLKNEINSFKINLVPGKFISATTLPERIITVKYSLIAKTPQEFIEKYRKLMTVLNNCSPYGYPVENVVFSFADDTGTFYSGMLGDIESPPEGSLSVVSRYSLFCGDPYKYSLSSAYDLPKPLKYDEGHQYGEKGYANTTGFDWIYSRHYSGLENYSSLNTDIKITIKGTVKGGSVTHLESGVKLTFPDVTNGTIVIDGSVFNVQVNGVDTVFDGEFPVLCPGGNGFLFEAETVNAKVSFDWYHKFM